MGLSAVGSSKRRFAARPYAAAAPAASPASILSRQRRPGARVSAGDTRAGATAGDGGCCAKG